MSYYLLQILIDMKKLLVFLLITTALSISFTATSQSTFRFNRTATNSTSRFFNTTPDTVNLYLPGYYKTVGLQPVVTKDSGTVTGTVIIYGSIDGVNYVSTGDTLTLTNVATKTDIYKHTDPVWVYYRAIALGSGTMAAKLQVYYTARRD